MRHFLPLLTRERRGVFRGAVGTRRLDRRQSPRRVGRLPASKAALNQIIAPCRSSSAEPTRSPSWSGFTPARSTLPCRRPFQRQVDAARLFTPDQSAAYLLDVIAGVSPDDSAIASTGRRADRPMNTSRRAALATGARLTT